MFSVVAGLLEAPLENNEIDAIQHAKNLYTSCLNMSRYLQKLHISFEMIHARLLILF